MKKFLLSLALVGSNFAHAQEKSFVMTKEWDEHEPSMSREIQEAAILVGDTVVIPGTFSFWTDVLNSTTLWNALMTTERVNNGPVHVRVNMGIGKYYDKVSFGLLGGFENTHNVVSFTAWVFYKNGRYTLMLMYMHGEEKSLLAEAFVCVNKRKSCEWAIGVGTHNIYAYIGPRFTSAKDGFYMYAGITAPALQFMNPHHHEEPKYDEAHPVKVHHTMPAVTNDFRPGIIMGAGVDIDWHRNRH